MKRICFIVDSIFSIGGVQRVTAVIAKELAKDYDVTIMTFDQPDTEDTNLYGLKEANIHYRFFSYPHIGKFIQKLYKIYSGIYLKLGLRSEWASNLYAKSSFPAKRRNALAHELQQGNYDIIIGVHAPLAARLATLRKKLKGVKLIGWIHNSFEALFSDTSLYIGLQRKRHYVYQFRKLDRTIVLCQHDANSYSDYDKQMVPMVIYNPLTLTPGAKSEGISKKFLAVGRFSRQHKGFDLLIEAFHLFAQKNLEWQLHIVGEGVEEELYRSLIKKYDLKDRVFIHPFTNHIQAYYSNAQVYVLSSRWEGFGLVLVEAMAHGLPIVSSDLPTSKEIMGDFALYFKNGNIQELAQRLEDATHINWQAKSKEALEIAQRFDIHHIIEQWKQTLI
jgi:glycosyltransferase involved in cell wall biosynthesis